MSRYVVTGGLGTGKTSLMEHLGDGLTTVAEPARELIAEHRAVTGETSLDQRPKLFVERLITRSIDRYASIDDRGIAVFDRGLPDCIAYASVFGVDGADARAAAHRYRYESTVFITPPWREVYTTDDMRRATFEQAVAFYEEVVTAYERLDYELVVVPRGPIVERARFVRTKIGV